MRPDLPPAAPMLVIGGRGQIGYFLQQRLAASAQPVLALSRQPGQNRQGWHWQQGELPGAMPELPALAAVISAGPLWHLVDWLASSPQLSCPLVIATSSMSAESKREAPLAAERDMAQRLRHSEQRLAELCRQQGRQWLILRPTLIYGVGLDHSLSPIARLAQRTCVFPLPSGSGLRQPVHADDVAAALLAALDASAAWGQVLACGGGERLSAAEMFARVRRSLPSYTLPLWLPATALRLLGWLLPQRLGMVARLQQDLIADNSGLRQLLGVHPRGFQPDASCWTAPGGS